MAAAFHKDLITWIPSCFRTSGLQYRSLSCMRTGRMSGIRRNRRSLRCRRGSLFQVS